MRRARSLRLIAGVAVAALALAACGSDSDTPAATSPATSAAASSAAVTETTDAAPTTEESMESSAGSEEPASSEAMTSESASSEAGSSEAMTSETAASSGMEDLDGKDVTIGFAYDIGGRGDFSFNDLAAKALDEAIDGYGIKSIELDSTQGEPESAKEERLRSLIDQGATAVVAVGFAYAATLKVVAEENPEISFAIIDDSSLADAANVASLVFAEEQGSFLVGAAAALKSESGHVGFVGGVNTPLIQKFQAGFEAGAKNVNPNITIDVKYITEPPDFAGFADPASGETIAKGMYDAGADIVYHASGGSGSGVFKAAKAAGKKAIGVDSDQYNVPAYADVKDVIMTSMLKRVDVATLDFITAEVKKAPLTGIHTYDLKVDGVGYSTSGGFIDDITSQLEDYKAQIVDGSLVVPATVG